MLSIPRHIKANYTNIRHMNSDLLSPKKAMMALLALVFCFIQTANSATLELKLFLQGFYISGGSMNPLLFNSGLSMDATDVDNITVKLIDPLTFTVQETVTGILKSDGSCIVSLTSPIGSDYYLNICHRNTLQTMSALPVMLSNITAYDFTTSASNSFGGNVIEVESGVYAFYTGDVNHDCLINELDREIVSDDVDLFLNGYICTDLNGDGFVEALDLQTIESNILLGVSCQFSGSFPPCPGCVEPSGILSWPVTYAEICSGDAPFQLSGATPTGGTYSGYGVDVNGIFHPIHPSGIGLQILTYTYFNPTTQQNETITNSIMVVDCPCDESSCRDFNDNDLHGWSPNSASPNVSLSLSNAGSQSGINDFYISAFDIDGPSKVETGNDFNGRWCCGEFCYDIKLFDDADNTSVLAAQPVFYIMRGAKGFKFTANTYVHETDGWQRICAPITNCNPMPVSSNGIWEPIAGTVPNDWDPVTNHIDAILFEADQFDNAGEIRGFDNVCFVSTGLSVTLDRVSCDTIQAHVISCCGPYTYTWSGGTLINDSTIINLSAGTTYTLTVVNGLGESASASISVDEITADAGPDVLTCTPGNPIMLHGSTNISGATMTWTALGAGSIFAGQGTSDIQVLGEGCYELTVTDPITGCTASDIVCVVLTNCPAEALAFDGVDDYISLGSNSIIKPQTELTVELWLHQSDWASVPDKTIIGNTQNGGYSIEFDAGNMLSSWVFRNGTYGIAQFNCSGLTSGWHHLAVTYDGQFNKLYVDGIMVASNDANGVYPIVYNAANSTIIGAEAFDLDEPEANTNCSGIYDELRIWDHARDCGELILTKNCELTGTETGLLAYYKFNQGNDAQPNPTVTLPFDSKTNAFVGELRHFTLDGTTSNWIAPGAIATGSTCTGTVTVAEIEIRGNSIIIQDGDALPSLADHTDFGTVYMTNTLVRTFTIHNTGNAPMNVSSLTVTGGDFTISGLIGANPILPGNSAQFEITFGPLIAGTKTAIVNIITDDCDETNYDFAILGIRDDCFTCNSQNTTPSLVINTGYNENTNSAFGIGATELNWTITQQPSWSALTLPANATTIYYNPSNNPNFFPFPNSQWISPDPSGNGGGNVFSELPFTFEYDFCLCETDTVTFDLHSLVDDSLLVYLNNYSTILNYQSVTLTGQQAGQQNYLYTFILPKGTHTLKADLRNYGGPLGFDIGGTISGNHLLKHGSCNNTYKFVDAGFDIKICNTGSGIQLQGTTNISGGTINWTSLNGGVIVSGQGTVDPIVNGNDCYVLTVIDPLTNCEYSDTVCVEVISVLVTATVTDILCGGQATGRIEGMVLGGEPGYSVAIDPDLNNVSPVLDANFNFENLPVGAYEITGVDGNGCTYTETFTIIEPLPLSVIVVPPNELCTGDLTAVEITVTGGNGDYTYSIQLGLLTGTISHNSTISTASILNGGIYSLTVTDANGCNETVNFTITEIFCCDSLNPLGIERVVNGDFRNSTPGIATTLDNLCECETNSYCIATNARLKCPGFTNTSDHSSTVSGTLPPYNFLIVDGHDVTPSIIWLQNIGSIVANYTYVFSYWIEPRLSNSPPSPDISLRVRDANNISTTFTLHNLNGTSIPNQWTQYVGTWTPSVDIASADLYLFQTNSGFLGNDYGIDDISFRGCQRECPDSILTTSLVMSTGFDHISNAAYGTNVSDGGWSVVHTTPDITVAKPYSAWTIDKHPSWPNALGNGQWISAYNHYRDVYLNPAPDSAYEFEYCFCLCKEDTVKFDFNALADDYAEFYLLEDPTTIIGSVSSWSTPQHIQYERYLPPGQHCIRAAVRNLHSVAMGLSIAGTIESEFLLKWGECDGVKPIIAGPIDFNVPNDPQVGIPNLQNPTCFGVNNGSISVPVYGGTPPYTHSWSNGVTTPSNIDLAPGSYTLIVTDSLGSSVSASYILTGPAPITVTPTVISNVTCYGGSDGSVNLITSGGVGTISYDLTYYNPSGTTGGQFCYENSDCPLHWYCNSTVDPPRCHRGSLYPMINDFVAGIFHVIATDSLGCTSEVDSFTITQPDSLQIIVSSGVISCFGNSTPVMISASGGIVPYSGTGTYSQFAGTTTYTIIDANGCPGSVEIALLQPSKVEGTITSILPGCLGSDGSASVIATGGTGSFSYQWSANAGSQTTATATGLSPGNYSVIITDANGCTGSSSATVGNSVAILPAAPGPISGTSAACRNTSGFVFSVSPVPDATGYLWTLPNGASGISTTNSITVSFSSTYNGGFISVAALNACGVGPQVSKNIPVITTYPTQPTVISGPAIACDPQIVTYSTTANNALGFNWTVAGGMTILSGQGTNTITVNLPAGFGQGSVQVYSTNCYSNSAVRGMIVTGNPVLAAVTGSNYVCANSSSTYSTSVVPGATSYIWSVTGNATLGASTQTSTTTSQVINFGAGWTSGIVTVTGFNSCGSSSKSFTVFSNPTQPGSISGLGAGLCELTNQVYSIAPVSGATNYQWTVPSGVTINSTNGLSVNVNFTPAFTSAAGNICVSALNSCGASPLRCYTVTSRPAIPTVTGPNTVCKSENAVSYSANTVSSASSWNWSVTGGATIIPSGSSAIVNYTSSTGSSSIVRANAINNCGSSQPGQKNVAINPGCRIGTEDTDEIHQSEFNLYPNPTKGNVHISFIAKDQERFTIKITDMLGNLISDQQITCVIGFNSFEIDLDKIAKGLYVVNVRSDNNNFETKRLVIE